MVLRNDDNEYGSSKQLAEVVVDIAQLHQLSTLWRLLLPYPSYLRRKFVSPVED